MNISSLHAGITSEHRESPPSSIIPVGLILGGTAPCTPAAVEGSSLIVRGSFGAFELVLCIFSGVCFALGIAYALPTYLNGSMNALDTQIFVFMIVIAAIPAIAAFVQNRYVIELPEDHHRLISLLRSSLSLHPIRITYNNYSAHDTFDGYCIVFATQDFALCLTAQENEELCIEALRDIQASWADVKLKRGGAIIATNGPSSFIRSMIRSMYYALLPFKRTIRFKLLS